MITPTNYLLVSYVYVLLAIWMSHYAGKSNKDHKHTVVFIWVLSPIFFPVFVVILAVKLLYLLLGFKL